MNASRDGGSKRAAACGDKGKQAVEVGGTDRKAGSLLITVVFNIRKCQNGNGAHITLSIALLAAAGGERPQQVTGWKNQLRKVAGLNFHLARRVLKEGRCNEVIMFRKRI